MRTLSLVSCSCIVFLVGCGGEVSTATNPARPSLADAPDDAASASAPGRVAQTSNDRCARPRTISLTGGAVTLKDDTGDATDEFSSLDCESRGTADSLRGPQRYYQLPVRKGRTYVFSLTPSFHAVVYGFDKSAGCSERTIQSACRSKGARGFASGLINPGTGNPGATVFSVPPPFVPQSDMDLVLVVDSDEGSGSFVLTISET